MAVARLNLGCGSRRLWVHVLVLLLAGCATTPTREPLRANRCPSDEATIRELVSRGAASSELLSESAFVGLTHAPTWIPHGCYYVLRFSRGAPDLEFQLSVKLQDAGGMDAPRPPVEVVAGATRERGMDDALARDAVHTANAHLRSVGREGSSVLAVGQTQADDPRIKCPAGTLTVVYVHAQRPFACCVDAAGSRVVEVVDRE